MKIFKNKIFIIISIVIILSIIGSFLNKIIKNKNIVNIGIVDIEGTILESREIVETLNDFNENNDINGIIVRINSPGGAVAPSQEIFEAVNKISLEDKKPIIASISSTGASGGYYIAIGADKIMANSGSIVGSIGVIISFPIAKSLLDKVGLKFETFASGEYKDSGSPYRDVNLNDQDYFKEIVNDMHNQFITEVSKQRNISIKKIEALANGKIYTGKMAYENNLIDTLGTFEDALILTKNMSNIKGKINLIYPDKDEPFLYDLIGMNTSDLFNYVKNKFYKMPLYIMGGVYD
tara:strand:- start:255 stop:1133 length:879 start_codon:yes stop_codon:yes gene_type:complete